MFCNLISRFRIKKKKKNCNELALEEIENSRRKVHKYSARGNSENHSIMLLVLKAMSLESRWTMLNQLHRIILI